MPLSLDIVYRFDDFALDPANRAFSRAGTQIPLSAKSCQVLAYLVANPGRVVEYPVLHENLATIYRSVNCFEDSRTSALTSSQVGKHAPSLHLTLFDIAFAQKDEESLARESQWFDVQNVRSA